VVSNNQGEEDQGVEKVRKKGTGEQDAKGDNSSCLEKNLFHALQKIHPLSPLSSPPPCSPLYQVLNFKYGPRGTLVIHVHRPFLDL
jgi:hypothetical protein